MNDEPNEPKLLIGPRALRMRHWGHLTVLNEWEVPEVANGPNGPYATGRRDVWWHLVCDCGQEFEMDRAEFPGKRAMPTCGREDCEFNKPKAKRKPGRPSGTHTPNSTGHVTVSAYLPSSFINEMRIWAKSNDMSLSKAFCHWIKIGLDEAKAEENAVKAKALKAALEAKRRLEASDPGA